MSNLYSNIPVELKNIPQWLMWKLETREGKPTKVPYQTNGKKAGSTYPETWTDFEKAVSTFKDGGYNGIGFVFTDNLGYIAIDWDKARDPETGKFKPGILEEILSTCSYSEISQSGTGAHSICLGQKPGTACKKNDREMYTSGRFFVMTGDHIPETPSTIQEAPREAIQAIYDSMVGNTPAPVENSKNKVRSPDLTDERIISLLMGSKLATTFEELYDGILSEYDNNASVADYHLCRLIAFYTQKPDQIERITRRSNLVREKWDRPDYVERTISSAIDSLNSVYTGSGEAPQNEKKDEDDIETMSFSDIRKLKEAHLNNRLNMDVLPDDHYLTIFRKWQETRTDAYPDYHFMGGLWSLSAFCRGKVVLKLKSGHVKPNLWVQILGLTTISHKTTSIENTQYIFETVTEKRVYNSIYSLEGYLEDLQKTPIANYIYDEVAGLLAKMHAKYNDGIFDLDCALYGGKSIQKTLASKKGQPNVVTVDDPYVTKLYGTTPEKYTTNIQQVDFDCGWGFRFLFCWPRYKKGKMGLAVETQEDVDARATVIARALKIYQLIDQYKELPFTVEPGVLEYLDSIVGHHENIAWNTDNDAYAAATGRGQENCLKIAMLLEIGKSKPSFCITLDTMKYAADLVFNYFVPTTLDVCDRIQEDIRNNQIEKIISILRKSGGVGEHSETLKKSKIMGKIFNDCINTMVESVAIKVYKVEETGKRTYVLQSGGDMEKFNPTIPQVPKIPSIPQFSPGEEGEEKKGNLISEDTTYTPTEYFGFLRESGNLENLENLENSKDRIFQHPYCEDKKPINPSSEVSTVVEKLDDVNTSIENLLDKWEAHHGRVFAGNKVNVPFDIKGYNDAKGIDPKLIFEAVEKRSKGRCLDCGVDTHLNVEIGEGYRCKSCHDIYSNPPAVVIPDEISLDPAEVTL